MAPVKKKLRNITSVIMFIITSLVNCYAFIQLVIMTADIPIQYTQTDLVDYMTTIFISILLIIGTTFLLNNKLFMFICIAPQFLFVSLLTNFKYFYNNGFTINIVIRSTYLF